MTFHSPTLRQVEAIGVEDANRTLNSRTDVMNNTRLRPKVDASTWDQKIPFHLLVAYEDPGTRDRALHLSHHLSKQLAADYDFHCSWWKFNHLANTILHQQAAHAATEANMIVVAVQARATPPPIQAEWLRSWLPRRSKNKAALVALVATPETGQPSDVAKTTEFLQALAKSAGMDFFNHSFELPKLPAPVASVPTARAAEVPVGAPSHVANPSSHFRMPIPRWGINE